MKHRPFPKIPESVILEVNKQTPYSISTDGMYDLHHCILTKKHVMGMPDTERAKINSKYNLMRLPKKDNASHANIPSWIDAIKWMSTLYSYEEVRDWYASIEWKGKPPFRFPQKGEL